MNVEMEQVLPAEKTPTKTMHQKLARIVPWAGWISLIVLLAIPVLGGSRYLAKCECDERKVYAPSVAQSRITYHSR